MIIVYTLTKRQSYKETFSSSLYFTCTRTRRSTQSRKTKIQIGFSNNNKTISIRRNTDYNVFYNLSYANFPLLYRWHCKIRLMTQCLLYLNTSKVKIVKTQRIAFARIPFSILFTTFNPSWTSLSLVLKSILALETIL